MNNDGNFVYTYTIPKEMHVLQNNKHPIWRRGQKGSHTKYTVRSTHQSNYLRISKLKIIGQNFCLAHTGEHMTDISESR